MEDAVELDVVLIRGHSTEPWGLQLEYQLYRGTSQSSSSPSSSREHWGCFAVVDTRQDSPAARDPALRVGDTIVAVDGVRVSAAKRDDFAELLSILHSKGRAVLLTLSRQQHGKRKHRQQNLYYEGDDEGVSLRVTTFQNHETYIALKITGPEEETPATEEDEAKMKPKEREENEVGCAAYRFKFVPLDDESCRGARFAGLIGTRTGYETVREGDVLVEVDGKCAVDLEYAEILAVLRRPLPLHLKFVHCAYEDEEDDDDEATTTTTGRLSSSSSNADEEAGVGPARAAVTSFVQRLFAGK